MAVKTTAQLLADIPNNFPDNIQRLITEGILRGASADWVESLINRISDKDLLNLRVLTDRPYEVGEGVLYDNGGGTRLYECILPVTGLPFDPAEWSDLSGGGAASGISYNNGTSGLTATNVQTAIDEVVSLIDIAETKTFYVNSNNPDNGDGSVVNPFKTIDLCYAYVIGTGDNENPEQVTIGELGSVEVAVGVYTTANNLGINRIIWDWKSGAKITYTGSDYLYNYTDAIVGTPSSAQVFHINGAADYTLQNGGLLNVEKRNSDTYARIVNIDHGFIFSTYATLIPTSRPVFQLNDGHSGDNAYREQVVINSFNQMFINDVHVVNIGSRGGVVWNGNGTNGRIGVNSDTNSLIRLVNSDSANLIVIKDVEMWGYGTQYYYEFAGKTKVLQLDGLGINAGLAGSPPEKFIHFTSTFDIDNVNYPASQNTTHVIQRTAIIYDKFTSSEIVTSSTVGDLESLFLHKNVFSGSLSANIKIAKSVSFEPSGANPKPYVVNNIIEEKEVLSNVSSSVGLTKVLKVDDYGNIFYDGDLNSITTEYVTLLSAKSTATNQTPSGLDAPLKVEFGAAQGVANVDEVAITAAGAVTVRDTQEYRFVLDTHSGRIGGVGVSLLLGYFKINGVIHGDSVQFEIDDVQTNVHRTNTLTLDLTAGDVVEFFIVRDPSENNSGELRVLPVTATGIPVSVTAALQVAKLVSTGNAIGVPSNDVDAVHVNVANEISGITEKVAPVNDDYLIIEDSENAGVKKKIKAGNLPSAGASLTVVTEPITQTSWSGNTNQDYAVVFAGSVVGNTFSVYLDEDVSANTRSAGVRPIGYAWCAVNGTVQVTHQVSSFITIPGSSVFRVVKTS